ncbi:Transposon TX1 uncharacterized protein [Nymphaea thermarum]|nr:Transposon TX1 uncharacterized protein [Nymphaea thermarum]
MSFSHGKDLDSKMTLTFQTPPSWPIDPGTTLPPPLLMKILNRNIRRHGKYNFVSNHDQAYGRAHVIVGWNLITIQVVDTILCRDWIGLIAKERNGSPTFASFDSKADIAPGPDSFSTFFFQRYWHIFGDDVTKAIKGFFETGHLVKKINRSILVLIPKHQGTCSPQDLKPIALYNSLYKFNTKVICFRMRPILASFIVDSQGAFTKGRKLQDRVAIRGGYRSAQPGLPTPFPLPWPLSPSRVLADGPHGNGGGGGGRQRRRGSGFHDTWIARIMTCVSTASIGVVGQYFDSSDGLKHGDPMSPLLFIVIMEYLHKRILYSVNMISFVGQLYQRLRKLWSTFISMPGRQRLATKVLAPMHQEFLYKIACSSASESTLMSWEKDGQLALASIGLDQSPIASSWFWALNDPVTKLASVSVKPYSLLFAVIESSMGPVYLSISCRTEFMCPCLAMIGQPKPGLARMGLLAILPGQGWLGQSARALGGLFMRANTCTMQMERLRRWRIRSAVKLGKSEGLGKEQETGEALSKVLLMEEIMWKQRSRVRWVAENDAIGDFLKALKMALTREVLEPFKILDKDSAAVSDGFPNYFSKTVGTSLVIILLLQFRASLTKVLVNGKLGPEFEEAFRNVFVAIVSNSPGSAEVSQEVGAVMFFYDVLMIAKANMGSFRAVNDILDNFEGLASMKIKKDKFEIFVLKTIGCHADWPLGIIPSSYLGLPTLLMGNLTKAFCFL